jgi:hypothetical protein
MSGAIHPYPQYAFMAWCSVKKSTEKTLPETLYKKQYTFERHATFVKTFIRMKNNIMAAEKKTYVPSNVTAIR